MKLLSLLLILSLDSLQAGAVANQMFLKALAANNLDQIELLLSTGFDPNLPIDGCTPLCQAMLSNRIDAVKLLLSGHADPNTPERGGAVREGNRTPLQFAMERGNFRLARILIEAGARVNAQDTNGETPLHHARGSVEWITFLIEHGADPRIRDAEGASPLDNAAWDGNLDAAAILLAHGAALDEPETKTGATPLNEAAHQGHAVLVRYLLRFHPDIEIPDQRGYSPLDNAIRTGHEDCALLLLEAEPKEMQTPQFLIKAMEPAAKKDESAVVAALLQRRASANDPLPSGFTPLGLAATSGAINVVQVLLNNSADPNASSQNGATPLEEASLRGFDAIVTVLLDHGAQVNQLNRGSGTTALYAAASFGKTGTVKLLLDRGADPTVCGPNRKIAYQVAVENGYSEVATLIGSRNSAKSCRQ